MNQFDRQENRWNKTEEKKRWTNWRDALTNAPAQCENNESQSQIISRVSSRMEGKRIIVSLFLSPSPLRINYSWNGRGTCYNAVYIVSPLSTRAQRNLLLFFFYPPFFWIHVTFTLDFHRERDLISCSGFFVDHQTKNIVGREGTNFGRGFAWNPFRFLPDRSRPDYAPKFCHGHAIIPKV